MNLNPVKRRRRNYKCEICEQHCLSSRQETVCEPCDAEMKRAQDAEDAKRAQRHANRRCRLCTGPLDASRYFSCKQCIPDHAMESESDFDGMEAIGYGDDDVVPNSGCFKPIGARTEKQCGRCNVVKPISEFGLYNKNNPTSYRSYCKPCYRIKTNEQYERMRARRLQTANNGVSK